MFDRPKPTAGRSANRRRRRRRRRRRITSQNIKYTFKSNHKYILYIGNDGKTANNYMLRPLKSPSSGCTFSERELYIIQCMLCSLTTHCSLRLIERSELDVPTFATRRLQACHHARAPSGGRWNCGREMSGNFA